MNTGALYDAVMKPLGRLGLDAWRRELLEGLDGRILEVGTGSGLLLELEGVPRPAVAVDLEEKNLERARKRAPEVLLLQADAESLPFEDESFDAAVASLVFCSIARPEVAARELFRVLRPGGRARLLEHVRVDGVAGRVQDALTVPWKVISGGCHLNREPHQRLTDAGFELVRRVPHARGYVALIEARRPALS